MSAPAPMEERVARLDSSTCIHIEHLHTHTYTYQERTRTHTLSLSTLFSLSLCASLSLSLPLPCLTLYLAELDAGLPELDVLLLGARLERDGWKLPSEVRHPLKDYLTLSFSA